MELSIWKEDESEDEYQYVDDNIVLADSVYKQRLIVSNEWVNLDNERVRKVVKANGAVVQDVFLLERTISHQDDSLAARAILLTFDGLKEHLLSLDYNHGDYLYQIGKLDTEKPLPKMVGLSEFAETLGWSIGRMRNKLTRQENGSSVKNPLPLPIQKLSNGPIWTIDQVNFYKKSQES